MVRLHWRPRGERGPGWQSLSKHRYAQSLDRVLHAFGRVLLYQILRMIFDSLFFIFWSFSPRLVLDCLTLSCVERLQFPSTYWFRRDSRVVPRWRSSAMAALVRYSRNLTDRVK